jgi:flagellar basal body-associated protein FliL
MAEEEEEQAGEGDWAPPAEGGASRVPQFIVLIFVILLGQGAAAYYMITSVYYPGLVVEEPEVEGETKAPRERPVFEIDEPLLFEIGEMTMNPRDNEGIRFLNAMVTVEVDVPEALDVLKDGLVAAQLYDLVFGILTTTQFKAMDDADERAKIKENLKKQINESPLLEDVGEVTNVYFERFVLQ